jgi:hypothetical protein
MRRKSTATRSARAGRVLPALGIASVLASAGWALEAPAPAQGIVEPPRSTADRTVDKIIQRVEKKHSAKVITHDEREDKGRKVLVLKLYDEKKGRVWEVRVDVESGKEL